VEDEKGREPTILYLSDGACAPHEVEGPPVGQRTGANLPAEVNPVDQFGNSAL
jgi:hypothetical protein